MSGESSNSICAIKTRCKKTAGSKATVTEDLSNLSETSTICSKKTAELKMSSEEQMTILDVIDDCLENIFERLSLEDLINVAQSNLVLKAAACSVFARTYGSRVVIYTCPPVVYVREKIFEGTRSIETILQSFGSSITKMCLHYDLHDHHYDKFLEDAIFNCCVESLTNIYISNCHSNTMKGFNTTFSNIRKAEFRYGQLGKEVSRFDKRFPKIEHLTLNAIFSPDCVMKHFPTLTVLKLYNPIESSMLTIESIMSAICLNPQLRVLKLDHANNTQLDTKFLRFISQKLPKLEILGLLYPTNIFDSYEQDDVEFKALRKLILKVGSAKILKNIPLRFEELLELKLVILRNPNHEFIDFLIRAKKIKTLTIRIHEGAFVANERCMLEFARMIPNVTELFLQTPVSVCTANGLIQFVGKCKSLEKVYILKDRNDFESVPNWEIVRGGKDTIGHELLLMKSKYLAKQTSMATEDNHKPIISSDRGSRVLITTKYLLRFLSYHLSLHIDTTYKFIRQPVSIFGVTDFEGHFKPVGLAITINEWIEDYEFIFRSIKENILDFDYKPEALISITTPAIQIAAEKVFGNATLIITCSSYVQKSVYEWLTKDSSINKNDRKEILAELDSLQLAGSDQSLNEAIQAFLFKWNKYGGFVDYFKDKWVIENSNWHKGVRQGTSNNNGLESFYRSMKGLDSLNMLRQCVEGWSEEYFSF